MKRGREARVRIEGIREGRGRLKRKSERGEQRLGKCEGTEKKKKDDEGEK